MPSLRCWAGPLDGAMMDRPGTRWRYVQPFPVERSAITAPAPPTTMPPMAEHVYALGPHPLLAGVQCWLYQSG